MWTMPIILWLLAIVILIAAIAMVLDKGPSARSRWRIFTIACAAAAFTNCVGQGWASYQTKRSLAAIGEHTAALSAKVQANQAALAAYKNSYFQEYKAFRDATTNEARKEALARMAALESDRKAVAEAEKAAGLEGNELQSELNQLNSRREAYSFWIAMLMGAAFLATGGACMLIWGDRGVRRLGPPV